MNCVIVAFAYIAAVIGAGFASGAEVVSFFLVHGRESIFGILAAGLFFSGFSYIILRDCIREDINSFSVYLKFLMPPFWQKVTSTIVFVFMAVSLAAMSAAAGEILNSIFSIPKLLGVIIFSVLCAVVLSFSLVGITRMNSILGVLISVGILALCVYIINFRFFETFASLASIITSAASYTAYNGVSAAVILCGMSGFLKTKKEAAITSGLIGGGLLILLAALWCVIGIYYGKVDLGEIPMLSIAARQGKWVFGAYSTILFLAVFSTAISNGFGVSEYLSKITTHRISVFLSLLFMVFLSGIGFYRIVDIVYRLCGYASLILPIFMLIKAVKKRKTKKNKAIRK